MSNIIPFPSAQALRQVDSLQALVLNRARQEMVANLERNGVQVKSSREDALKELDKIFMEV